MSMLGYEELMRNTFNVERTSVEILLKKVQRAKVSPLRLSTLKSLAKKKPQTISGILLAIGQNNTGGTYKSIHTFFILLENEHILNSKKQGRRTYWSYSTNAEELAKYLQ